MINGIWLIQVQCTGINIIQPVLNTRSVRVSVIFPNIMLSKVSTASEKFLTLL